MPEQHPLVKNKLKIKKEDADLLNLNYLKKVAKMEEEILNDNIKD